MAESADAWTDIYMTNASTMSLHPHLAATKQAAATATTYAAETRTEGQAGAGDILWNTVSFAVIMA
jgi:hypothetical protein